MTEKIKGKILAINQESDRFGIKIGEKWYNGFGICHAEKGDVVEIEYELKEVGDRVFRNVKKVTKIEEKPEIQRTVTEIPVQGVIRNVGEEEKNRRCALIQAVNFVMAVHKTENMDRGELVDLIMEYAKAFENYIRG